MNTTTQFTKSDNISFQHIYNGLIFDDDTPCLMIKFKIESKLSEPNTSAVFDDIDSDVGWFQILHTDKRNCLIGPIKLDLDLIKTDIQQIKDERYRHLNEKIIESVSNDQSCMIDLGDVPEWMNLYLVSKTKLKISL
jgi:hypothetical protein